MSTVKQIQQQHETVSQQAQKYLHLDELSYGQFMYDMGLLYLRENLGLPECYVNLITSEKIFWNWWKVYWYQREENFVAGAAALSLKARKNLHNLIHSPNVLSQRPHRCVLQDSYAKMMQVIIDQPKEVSK